MDMHAVLWMENFIQRPHARHKPIKTYLKTYEGWLYTLHHITTEQFGGKLS